MHDRGKTVVHARTDPRHSATGSGRFGPDCRNAQEARDRCPWAKKSQTGRKNDSIQHPWANGVRHFHNWVIDCVKKGGTGATVAAVTAAANGLLNDALTVKAIHG